MTESARGRAIRKPPQAAKLRRRPVDPEAELAARLRSTLGRFATGVAVVTFDAGDGPRGVTVNSFTSVSLEPPLVLVSIAKTASAHDRLRDRAFCVNVLGAEQEPIARRFAGGDAGVEPGFDERGDRAPRLAGTWTASPGAPTTAATTRCSWARSPASIIVRATRSDTWAAGSPRSRSPRPASST
jgi:hypothetical protein